LRLILVFLWTILSGLVATLVELLGCGTRQGEDETAVPTLYS